jgi:hypothetical protein
MWLKRNGFGDFLLANRGKVALRVEDLLIYDIGCSVRVLICSQVHIREISDACT